MRYRRAEITAHAALAALVLAGAVPVRGAPGAGEPSDPAQPLPAGARCAAEPLRPRAPITYVCDCAAGADPGCVPGDDRRAGDRATAPKRSYPAALERFRSMPAGATVAFCRGGRWEIPARDAGRWVNFRCRADRTCDVRDYEPPWGNGKQGRPVLVQEGEYPLFGFGQGEPVSPKGGVRILNLELRGSGKNPAFLVIDEIADVTICNNVIEGFQMGVILSGSARPGPGEGRTPRNERVAIVGNRFLRNVAGGLFGGCDGCTVEGNLFDDNGGPDGSRYRHSIYLASQPGPDPGTVLPVRDMRVAHNTLRRSARNGTSCVGTALVVHGRLEGLIIEDNVVEEEPGSAGGGCHGITVGCGGYPYGCWFHDVAIRRNVVRNVGTVGIGVSSCAGCVVENNVVVADREEAAGISAAVEAARADPKDEPNTRLTIRNNTVFFTERVRGGVGIGVTAEGTAHVVANNAIAYLGKGGADGWSCLDVRAPAGAFRALDHNLCWFPSAPLHRYGGGAWQGAAGTVGQPLVTWRASSQLDLHSLQVAPGFLRPPADLTPGPASPLAGAGAPEHAPATDLLGKPRGPRPAIGALEP